MQFKELGRQDPIVEAVDAADDLLGIANEIPREIVSAAAATSRLETCKLLEIVVPICGANTSGSPLIIRFESVNEAKPTVS